MRLMLIGMDRKLFDPESTTHKRIARLGGEYTDALDTVVFSMHAHGISSPQELAPNTHAYPTNSRSRLLYGWDALRIARTLPRADVVSTQDPFETGLCGLLLAWYWRVPLAIEIHTDFLDPSYVKHSKLNRLRVHLAGFVLRHAAGGYAASARIQDRVQARYPYAKPLSVLPIYISIHKYRALVHEQHPHYKTAILWVGRMEEEKRPMLALEAVIAARAAGHDVGITFVGDGRLRTALEARVREEGLERFVTFTGWEQDLTPYYKTADLLLVTSAYEGYGMVIVEALAAGVPVLSTDVGIAHDAGAMVATADVFAKALTNWLEGPRERGTLKLPTYPSEEAYLRAVRDCYAALIK